MMIAPEVEIVLVIYISKEFVELFLVNSSFGLVCFLLKERVYFEVGNFIDESFLFQIAVIVLQSLNLNSGNLLNFSGNRWINSTSILSSIVDIAIRAMNKNSACSFGRTPPSEWSQLIDKQITCY
jgi:hypothetical protein